MKFERSAGNEGETQDADQENEAKNAEIPQDTDRAGKKRGRQFPRRICVYPGGRPFQTQNSFHEDVTGKEITSKLLAQVRKLENVEILEYTSMTDIIERESGCAGVRVKDRDGKAFSIYADNTILASGGIGGLYKHSTNFPHLTGDALEVAKKHGIRLEHLDYVQIHPTTLYSKKPGRRFLISESVRGEGAVLLNKDGERFVDELQPRDVVTQAIRKQMEKDGTDHVWLSMKNIDKETILKHFPNIYHHCLEEGYDVTREPIPVVPAQHYFMGGHLGGPGQPYLHGASVRCRRNQLQRGTRREPSGQQLAAGESGVRETGGKENHRRDRGARRLGGKGRGFGTDGLGSGQGDRNRIGIFMEIMQDVFIERREDNRYE